MSNAAKGPAISVVVAQLLWRRAIYAVLAVNLLFSAVVLSQVLPQLPQEVSYIFQYAPFLSYAPSDLFDYKYMILTAIALIALIPSLFALFGKRWVIALAWLGFAANLGLCLVLWFVFFVDFKFKCCGYL
jgi:hypothetical protein